MARPYKAEKQIRWWLYDNGFSENAFGPYVQMLNDDNAEVATIAYWDAATLGRVEPDFAEYNTWAEREASDDSTEQKTTTSSDFTLGIIYAYHELVVDRDVQLRVAINSAAPHWVILKLINNDGVSHDVIPHETFDMAANLTLAPTSEATLILFLYQSAFHEVSRLQL